eukprot:COSAG02_NODE_907_length_16005_cov_3.219252_11_plen_76_part_00
MLHLQQTFAQREKRSWLRQYFWFRLRLRLEFRLGFRLRHERKHYQTLSTSCALAAIELNHLRLVKFVYLRCIMIS